MKCKICGKEFRQIGKHVWQKHNISTKEYYDKYFKKQYEDICRGCGLNTTSFISIQEGYRPYCSPGCAGKHTKEARENTCLRKYGVKNPFQADEIIEKIHQVKEEKYGDRGYHNKEKMFETKLKRYGDGYFSNHEKYKVTMSNKYGENVTNYFQTDEFKQKSKQTKLDKYGNEYYCNRAQAVETFNNKSDEEKREIYNRVQNSWLNKSAEDIQVIRDKQSIGISNYYKSATPEQLLSHRENLSLSILSFYEKLRNNGEFDEYFNRLQKKAAITKSKNNSWHTSKSEDEFYSRLCEYFRIEDIHRNYSKDDRYPFACDFYISSEDLFIECNFHWTHGGHWFDETNSKDIEIINKWKNKGTDFYDTAIDVWTTKDILKRDTAHNNKLYFKAFFTLSDAIKWLEETYEVK